MHGEFSVAYLPAHDAGVPALVLSLSDARSERGWFDVATASGISCHCGLTNYELVELDAVVRDLEQRGAREGGARGVDVARTVGVEALVVELDVVLRERSTSAHRKQDSRQTNAKHAPSR